MLAIMDHTLQAPSRLQPRGSCKVTPESYVEKLQNFMTQ